MVAGNDHIRSIPAWAGEPPQPCGECREPTVYPRVGGGTARRLA